MHHIEKRFNVNSGPEFGPDHAGHVMIIDRALHGLKSSGASWAAMIAQTMSELDYHSSSADPVVWIRQAVRTDGTEDYQYCLIYVDDILCTSEKPMVTMNKSKGLYI